MNTLAHISINADDVERARSFYARCFGWTFQAFGPPGFYMISGAAPAPVRASLQQRRELVPGKPVYGLEGSLAVANSEEAEAQILAAGGRIVMPRTVLAGIGRLFFFEDTEGNVMGAMEYDASVR